MEHSREVLTFCYQINKYSTSLIVQVKESKVLRLSLLSKLILVTASIASSPYIPGLVRMHLLKTQKQPVQWYPTLFSPGKTMWSLLLEIEPLSIIHSKYSLIVTKICSALDCIYNQVRYLMLLPHDLSLAPQNCSDLSCHFILKILL